MADQAALFHQIFLVTGPVFGLVLLGVFLKRIRLIDEAFVMTASNLTFRATMPTLLFLSILQSDLKTAFQPKLVFFFVAATLLHFGFVWLWSLRSVPKEDRGVYIQGAFRGNCGIMSLALAANQYGDYGLSVGGVLSGIIVIVFNILSAFILSIYSPTFDANFKSIMREIVRNPLIISVVAALVGSSIGLTLPEWVVRSGNYFAAMSLPTALICIGGTLSLAAFKSSGRVTLSSSLFKVFWMPLFFVPLAWLLGFEGRELGILFLFLATPTAAASYVMVRAAGSSASLAANIIALTTVISVVSFMAGLYVLNYLQLI
ncbi:AEC family transporter [Neptunomonas phycophila]|uniref:AEC family transporter n=1 Tax=Neptunomonas phycophila TaxID=1572645 RepID=A0AAW7XKD6_9GAMM|nr:AEC family transporter [Neptunomonas phycophila]MDO6454201.1 AEC family transporter [Neptunomonas phycophila]